MFLVGEPQPTKIQKGGDFGLGLGKNGVQT